MNDNKLRKALGLRLKSLAVFAVAVVASLAGTPRAVAYSNLQDAQFALAAQVAVSEVKIGGAPTTVAAATATTVMNLTYTGTAANAYVNIAASSITFYAPIGTGDTTIGSSIYGGSGGSFDLSVASVATMGQLCDLINGVQGPFVINTAANGGSSTGGNYHCTLTGAIRSDPTSNAGASILPFNVPAAGVNNLAAAGGFNVPVGTNTILSLGIIPTPGKHVVLNYCTANVAGASTVAVYGVKAKDGIASALDYNLFGAPLTDSTLAWTSPVLTANTTTNLPLATLFAQPWIEFGGGGAGYKYSPQPSGNGAVSVPVGNAYNGHVVVRASNFATPGPSTLQSNFLMCNWFER